jgi:hypothetical protein
MIDPASFKHFRLHGGFVIADLQFTDAPMLDALEREAVAQTRIIGREFRLLIQAGLSERELSISIYHEILEAATVGSWPPPDSVLEFNEGGFERAAQAAHAEWGTATPEKLNHMLQFHGFREE